MHPFAFAHVMDKTDWFHTSASSLWKFYIHNGVIHHLCYICPQSQIPNLIIIRQPLPRVSNTSHNCLHRFTCIIQLSSSFIRLFVHTFIHSADSETPQKSFYSLYVLIISTTLLKCEYLSMLLNNVSTWRDTYRVLPK